MAITITFNDAEFRRQLMQATAKGLQRAGVFLQSQCKVAVSKANPTKHRVKLTASQSAARGGQKSATVFSNMHNAYAGQPPFARTGMGRSSIVYEYNDNPLQPAVRVGVRANGLYMAYLELGTSKIKARPWLIAMLYKHRDMLARLACTGGYR